MTGTLITRKVAQYQELITESWRRTTETYLETAKLVVEAEATLNAGEWEDLKNTLPFGDSIRSMMMSIGKSDRFNTQDIRALLPPNYNILYVYSQLEDGEWEKALADGVVDTDISTEAVRKWKDTIKYGGGKQTPSKPTTRLSGPKVYATIPVIDDLPEQAKETIDEILEELSQELQSYGLDITYRADKTVRQQSIQDDKNKLVEKLTDEVQKELDKKGFNKLSPKKLGEMESAYFQRRYFQQNGKYPYPRNSNDSIQRKDHPYSISKMDFSEFMQVVRDKKVLMQWTPIKEWGVLGKAKCMKLALDHTLATTTNQRANYKRQLKNIVSKGSTNANHAQKYLDMLVA
jgi:hypothetical protein